MSAARTTLLASAVAGLAWLASGVFAVETGEVAVVWRFGAPQETVGAGLRVRLPWPIETHSLVGLSESRRVETGSTRMLTGDTNLIDLDLVVQYTISDPVLWLTSSAEPEAITAAVVLAVATEAVRHADVDTLLTTGRAALQQRLAIDGQARLDQLHAGVRLEAIEVRELAPPPAVVDAFNDVSSARGDKETLALAAEAYVSSVLPEARGTRSRRLEHARARSAERLAQARGDVRRFEGIQVAAALSPAGTRTRLVTDAWRQIARTVDVRSAPDNAVLSLSSLEPQTP